MQNGAKADAWDGGQRRSFKESETRSFHNSTRLGPREVLTKGKCFYLFFDHFAQEKIEMRTETERWRARELGLRR